MISDGYDKKELPKLSTPFPSNRKIWVCPKTGIKVPKRHEDHLAWREKMLKRAENDTIMQNDLLAACKESLLVWVNLFVWTRHEDRIDPETGKEYWRFSYDCSPGSYAGPRATPTLDGEFLYFP